MPAEEHASCQALRTIRKVEIPYSKQHQEIEIRNVIAFLYSLLSTFLEEIGPAEKSRMEPGKEPHAAREQRVGQP